MSLPSKRTAGACLHLTALPGRNGIGELGSEAFRFVDQLASMDLRVWQFLPLGPTAYGDSPYQPLSVFAGNPLLIDVEELLDAGLIRDSDAASLEHLPADTVDYARLIPLKRRLLTHAAERFRARASIALQVEYAVFLDRHDTAWLHDYALFELLKSQHQERPWPEWDDVWRQREPTAIKALETREYDALAAIKVVQFLFFRQWAALRRYATERGVRLFGDVPIYIALDSADAWSNPQLLLLEPGGWPTEVAGVPPDYFSDDGQRWGNPLYDWDYHRNTAYRWWVERMRHAMLFADMLRLDHFRGFESYWAIPASAATARDGHWRPGPADALFATLQGALGSLPIVAEDLGMITAEVDQLRERLGFPGMMVLQFLVGEPGFDPSQIPADCVCYTGTHDNDTTPGWFLGGHGDSHAPELSAAQQQSVLAATGGTPESVCRDLICLALDSPARLAMLPVQDMLGLDSEARFNTPGTTENNWRWRLNPAAIDAALIEQFAERISGSARGG